MASSNYGTAFDTEYNRKIHQVINQLNLEKDTNGEPEYFTHQLEGGAYLSADGKVVVPSHMYGMVHPHLVHPLLGSMAGDGVASGGRFSFGKALKGVGKVALPIATDVGKDLAKEAITGYLTGEGVPSGAGVYSGGKFSFGKALSGIGKVAVPIATDLAKDAAVGYLTGAGAGFIDPYTGSSIPQYIMPGGTASYPFYNMNEMNMVDARGGNFFKSVGRTLGSVGKDVGKHALKVGVDVGKDMAKDAITGYLTGEGVASGGSQMPMKRGRGRPRKTGAGLLDGAKKLAKKEGKKLLKKGADKAIDAGTAYAKKKVAEKLGGAVKRGRGRPKKDLVRSAIDDIEDLGYIIKKDARHGAEGGNFFKSLGRSFKKIGKTIAPEVAGLAAVATGNPELAPLASAGTKALVGSGKGDGRKRRAEIVKKVMKEKGMKMTEASSYVKKHGLYKK